MTITNPDSIDVDVRERCGRILSSLERTGPEHFSMDAWCSLPDDDADDADTDEISLQGLVDGSWDIELTSCGTTACLAGHQAFTLTYPERRHLRQHSSGFGMAAAFADLLAMPCNHGGYSGGIWFYTITWPDWAQADLRHRIIAGTAPHTAEWEIVCEVLADIVAGQRTNWLDPPA